MKFKKFLSCFLSIVMCLSMITAFPIGASAEEFNDTVVQTVFELKAEDILAGNVPAYVNVNTSILDTQNTSAANGVMSTTTAAETDFIQIDLAAAANALPGTDLDQYTIEVTFNAVDADSATKNGTLLYANGSANKMLLRVREGSDMTTNKNDWSGDQYKAATTNINTHYLVTNLKLADGTATSHQATYDTATATGTNLFSGVANGQALTAWANAPVRGFTIKSAAGYRANIASLKVTRQANFTSEDYVKETQTVFEMDADALKAGTIPFGVTLNTAILDENATSASALVSDAMASQTAFLTLDLERLSRALPGAGTGLYTIEVVVNQNDSDDTTQNGLIMSMTGTAKKDVWRVRESADIAVLNSWDAANSIFTSGSKHNAVASYVFTDLNVNTGAMASHAAKYGTSPVYNGYANGQSVAAGNASTETPINIIEFRTATTSAGGAMRANIKSLKVTRVAYKENVKYTVGATSEDEAKGTVAVTGLTDGQVLQGNNVTLTATAKDGYILKGWYKAGELVSTENPWTFAAVENVSYVAKFAAAREITQTVFELDAEALLGGTLPAGVTLNTAILDESASSASALISDVVSADTEFLTIDIAKAAEGLEGVDTGLYTIEIITNVIDSDNDTSNGTLMNLKGTSDVLVFRAREGSDISALNNSGWADGLYWRTESAGTATYRMEDLNIKTGAAAAHWLMRGSVVQHADNAAGHALGAGNASEDSPINILTVKAANTRRANITSLRITRKVLVENVNYTINAVTENEAYGTVAIEGVSEEEATKGQVLGGSEVTLTATAKDGYIFKGWYKEGEDVPASTEKEWTFAANESANYTARFVESYTINKTVFELDAASLEAGTVPSGVTLNTGILDENASSASALISDVVDADTAFLTIDLDKVGIGAGEEGLDIYTIEIVTNVEDSDDNTNNGTLMNLKGTSDVMVFRAREASDLCAIKNSGWADGLYWRTETAATATYRMEELDVTTGAATAHWLMRENVVQHRDNAAGHALAAGNATAETPINTLTVKAANGRRANIVSLKITRQVAIPREYVNVEAVTENDAYGIVNEIGDTAIKYSSITLSAEAKDGYIFDGWYNGNTLVSEENPWTFQVTEGFSYTAKFRKVVDEWVEVYGMDIADILSGGNTNGVVISNLDTENSSAANGLLSAESDASADFMTITFADLPDPAVEQSDVLTDIYRVDMKVNLVDSDDTTKNGILVYYNEVANANMLARARETRDGTFYKNGSATIYGASVGSQQIPSFAYNFKMDTESGLFNQYVKHGVGDYYLFTDTASRGDNITLPEAPEKIIIRNADYNANGVNENYRVSIKSLSVKRLVKVVDTGNAVPVFSKERVTVVAGSGEIWNGAGEFTTDIEKIIIDLGSEVDASQITSDSVYITCNDEKIESIPEAITGADGVTLVTLTGMTFEAGKSYKIIADGIVNVRGASLQKLDEYVVIKTKASTESGIYVASAFIGGKEITAASDITASTEVTVNVSYANIAEEKDVYVIYVAYKGGTMADVKLAKAEDIIGSGTKEATFTTGNVSDVEEINFILWEGWTSMKILDSFGF